MTAIPVFLLPHRAVLQKPVREGIWGSGECGQTVALSKVRVELKKARGSAVRGGTLYFDCRNSLPRNVVFEVGDVLTFEGEEYAVTAVQWFCGSRSQPHHAEISLS